VKVDEKDNDKTEISLPKIKTGKASQWEDWKYPDLTKTLPSSLDSSGGFVGLTTDDFDKVVSFYFQKCDVTNGTGQLVKSPYTTPDGNKLDYLMFRGFDSNHAGPAARVRFLNLKTPGYTVSIAVVQPQGQKETQIFVNLW
jgi:hypothetical protein